MCRLVRLLLLLFVFAMPWEYSLDLGAPWGNAARIAGLAALFAAVPAVLGRGSIRAPGPLPIVVLLYFLWQALTCIWSFDPVLSFANLRGYAQELMIVYLIWEFAETPEDLHNLLRAYLAGAFLLALLSVAELHSARSAVQSIRFAAEGQDPNDVARYLDLGFPLAALLHCSEQRRLWRLLAISYLPIGLAAVLLSASRGGFLAALIALAGSGCILARHRPRTLAFVAAPIAAAVAMVSLLAPHATLARLATIAEQLHGGDLNRRQNIWQAGWRAFEQAPLFGHGAGSFVYASGLAPTDTAHNTGLSILVSAGAVGLFLASILLFLALQALGRTRGALRIAFATAMLVWAFASLAATVEWSRSTWFLIGAIALAGRLAEEAPRALDACFEHTDPAPMICNCLGLSS
jgi:O-antigen ligase